MSDSERPDLAAFRELEQMIRALGDEMAAWRRRAQLAEGRLKNSEALVARAGMPDDHRAETLEHENARLRERLEAARQRTRSVLDRVRFMRQQHEVEAGR